MIFDFYNITDDEFLDRLSFFCKDYFAEKPTYNWSNEEIHYWSSILLKFESLEHPQNL